MSLLSFYGEECPHCQTMEPLIEQLQNETGLKVDRLEVWHNEENLKTLQSYDKDLCGGVPFFYNTENKKWICGEATLEELTSWATAHEEGAE